MERVPTVGAPTPPVHDPLISHLAQHQPVFRAPYVTDEDGSLPPEALVGMVSFKRAFDDMYGHLPGRVRMRSVDATPEPWANTFNFILLMRQGQVVVSVAAAAALWLQRAAAQSGATPEGGLRAWPRPDFRPDFRAAPRRLPRDFLRGAGAHGGIAEAAPAAPVRLRPRAPASSSSSPSPSSSSSSSPSSPPSSPPPPSQSPPLPPSSSPLSGMVKREGVGA